MNYRNARRGFTLIELLIVIAILTILGVVAVLFLNPSQLLAQGRDSNRISDMTDLTSVIGLYAQNVGGSMGSSSVVYVSIPDPNATSTAGDQCNALGLPALPLGYQYHCAASSTYRSVSGTGWIPLNLTNITNGSPIASLPADPTNASSSRLYYTYDTDGTHFEVTASMESGKYKLAGSNDVISSDGGALASVYEKGTKLGLEPLDYGDSTLVGFWALNEGTGTIPYDGSGLSSSGTWNGSEIGTNGTYYSQGNGQTWSGAFNGTNDYMQSANLPVLDSATQSFTITVWFKATASGVIVTETGQTALNTSWHDSWIELTSGSVKVRVWNCTAALAGTATLNQWNQAILTFNGSTITGYLNGVAGTPVACSRSVPGTAEYLSLGADDTTNMGSGAWFTGLIQDFRVYKRVLSAAEINALYQAGK